MRRTSQVPIGLTNSALGQIVSKSVIGLSSPEGKSKGAGVRPSEQRLKIVFIDGDCCTHLDYRIALSCEHGERKLECLRIK